MINLTRKFTFEMAHALKGYDGACRQIHGHSYKLFVTVQGEPCDNPENPKCGMVLDFSLLKAVVNRTVVDIYDHALVLKEGSISDTLLAAMREEWSNIRTVPYQPTCENMVVDIANTIAKELPQGVRLSEIKLYETENSYATYTPQF